MTIDIGMVAFGGNIEFITELVSMDIVAVGLPKGADSVEVPLAVVLLIPTAILCRMAT